MPAGDGRLSSKVSMEEVHEFGPYLRGGLATKLHGVRRAVLEMVRQQQFLGRAQCRMNRGELLHDVRTVALVLHHAADSVDLTASPSESVHEILLRGLADAHRVGRSAGNFGRHDLHGMVLYPSIVTVP